MLDSQGQAELQFSIPSITVQTHVVLNAIYLTHLQRAIFAYHADQPLQDKERYLKIIQQQTKDDELKNQIQEVIDNNDRKLKTFKDNHDDHCIYTLHIITYSNNTATYGYFQTAEDAIFRGLALNDAFTVTKSILWKSAEESLDKDPYISRVVYRNYKLYEAWVPELNIWYDSNHFTTKFCPVPNPFSRGDIVITTDCKVGVVETTKSAWKRYIEDDSGKRYEDVGIDVLLIDGDSYSSRKINPLELNIFDVDKTEFGIDDVTRMRLSNLRSIYMGEGSLEPIFNSLYEEAN